MGPTRLLRTGHKGQAPPTSPPPQTLHLRPFQPPLKLCTCARFNRLLVARCARERRHTHPRHSRPSGGQGAPGRFICTLGIQPLVARSPLLVQRAPVTHLCPCCGPYLFLANSALPNSLGGIAAVRAVAHYPLHPPVKSILGCSDVPYLELVTLAACDPVSHQQALLVAQAP